MMERFEVVQSEKNKYTFSKANKTNSEVTVFLVKNPDDKDKKMLYKTTENEFTIELDQYNQRAYFVMEHDGNHYVIGERTLRVDGMNNFRDMGGYETSDGKHVKWGMLYRSDHIHNASAAGVEFLKTLGIHTVIDYRSPSEISKYPNPTIDENVTTYVCDPNAHDAELSAQFTSSKDNEDVNLVNKIIEQKKKGKLVNRYDMVLRQYHTFVTKKESKDAFANMLRVLANPKSVASVQHCRGGKDRTGFGALLVLGILGVKKDELLSDYMITHHNRIARNNHKMKGYREITQDEDVLNYLLSLIETRPEFIAASYDSIIEEFGSIEKYAVSELGITTSEIQSLKDLYLE